MTRMSAQQYNELLARQKQKLNPRPKHTPGRMNKTEAAYAQLLELRRHAGEIADWKFESLKFRLADRTWYTPDFVVWLRDGGIECVEVKGFVEDDAAVKFKVAQEMYPQFRFRMVFRRRGEWFQK